MATRTWLIYLILPNSRWKIRRCLADYISGELSSASSIILSSTFLKMGEQSNASMPNTVLCVHYLYVHKGHLLVLRDDFLSHSELFHTEELMSKL